VLGLLSVDVSGAVVVGWVVFGAEEVFSWFVIKITPVAATTMLKTIVTTNCVVFIPELFIVLHFIVSRTLSYGK